MTPLEQAAIAYVLAHREATSAWRKDARLMPDAEVDAALRATAREHEALEVLERRVAEALS